MLKIKLYEHDVHRNETTFRPFIMAQDLFRDVGIEFTNSDTYDYAFVGQASIIDKKKSLQESIEKGVDFCSKITGDYIIVDGQDSTSLIGTIDVFRESNAVLFLKNSYLKDFDLYRQGWVNGRMYWGDGEYSVPGYQLWVCSGTIIMTIKNMMYHVCLVIQVRQKIMNTISVRQIFTINIGEIY